MKSIKLLIIFFLILPLSLLASAGQLKIANGDVVIQRAGNSIKGTANAPIEEKDTIITKVRSNAQIIFSDGTAISIGANSNFSIKEYLYDDSTNKANLKVKVSLGSFKAVTGAIGKISPDMFKMEMKTATIGIRGTRFVGTVPEVGPETVACTFGVITVAPLGRIDDKAKQPEPIEVKAGEITKVSDGSIEAPRKYTSKEIRAIEISAGRACNCK